MAKHNFDTIEVILKNYEIHSMFVRLNMTTKERRKIKLTITCDDARLLIEN